MGPPLRKPLSRWNFKMNTTLHIQTLKTTIFKQKKTQKNYHFEKAAKLPIFFSCCFDFGKNLECFNEIWLIIGGHEYIKIPEIKIGNFNSGGTLGAKHLLIYAN